jgi:membrane fusion protein, heavy metal efflux system
MCRSQLIYGLILVWCLPGCEPQKADSGKTAPAKIEHPKETDIYRIVLTPKAEQRLQISTVPVESKSMPRTRTVGGIVAIPDGASVIVTAPLTGTLFSVENQPVIAGSSIASGSTVFHLRPLLSPEREVPTAAERVAMANAKATFVSARIVADGDTKQAQAQVEAAEIALARAKKLLADRAGSQRDVDDAIARVEVAKKGLEAALARKQLLDTLTIEAETGQLSTIPIPAPLNGILRTVSSSVGQTVSAGAPLFEVVGLRKLWVRVPVYPRLRDEVTRESYALVRSLGADDGAVAVKPFAAPPSADPLAATVDLFYELSNTDGRFHPGERVEVTLPVAGTTESLVIPRAAILRDIHGIAWVYVNSADQTFERHRVEVHFTTDELSVLSRGPEVGTPVVVDGAAELFGTEFGAGK